MDDVINIQLAADETPGGVPAIRTLSAILVEECPLLMQQMTSAITDQDWATCARAAHTLKGSARVFHAQRVARQAEKLEQLARSESVTEITDAFQQLEEEVSLMIDTLCEQLDKLP